MHHMWKKIVTMSLVLVMLLSFTACAEEAEEEAELPSAQEIVDGVIEALDDVRAYEFEMDMTMDMAGEAEGEVIEMEVAMGFSGALDLENRQMRADIAMNMAMPGEDEMEMAMEMYLVDDMAYMMRDMPEQDPIWMKEEVPEGGWEEMTEILSLAEPQIELLELAEVEVIGSEKVKGVDCYVLRLTPDMEQLWQLVMQQTGITGEPMLPEVAEEILDEVFRSFSVKQWIAKDTYFLTKVEIDMSMEFTPETMGVMGEEGEMTMDIAMSYLAYNYNQPVSIVLPPEAAEL